MHKGSRNIAGLSLGIMLIGFLITLFISSQKTYMLLLQDGFMAGLVGGLADWFAVTALFRHPLGIPIPHTALVPKNRSKVTQSLITVIETELLNKESILQKVSHIPLVGQIIKFAGKQLLRPSLQKAMVSFAVQSIERFDTDRLVPLAKQEIKHFVNKIETAAILSKISNELIHNGYDEQAFHYIVQRTQVWVSKPEARTAMGNMANQALQHLEVNGLMQFALNAFIGFMSEEKLGEILQTSLTTTLSEMQQPNDLRRVKMMAIIRTELQSLSQNEQLIQTLDKWKFQWAEQMEWELHLQPLFANLKQKMIAYLSRESFAKDVMLPYLQNQLNHLAADIARTALFETWLHEQIVLFLESNHAQIGHLVRENLNKLDNKTLTELLEDKIGKDLQWIRVNGALCGYLIGIVLGAIKLWL